MNILITGGAGSLGRAFAIHLMLKHNVYIIDNNEWALTEAKRELEDCCFQLGDFASIKSLIGYDAVIHCAAYKHVELGESSIIAFIENNINKTKDLFRIAQMDGCRILFISTDKAVEPVSLYGYTKAIGEYLAKYYEGSVARLGNILNSSGSVIPIWEKAIADKKPLPITDMKMVRYYCEDKEAVKDIWNQFKQGDKLCIPKVKKITMPEMIKIVLEKHGLPLDYPIEIIGVRPGEKLEEKLAWDKED